MKLPKTATQTMYVHIEKHCDGVRLRGCNMSKYGYGDVCIGKVEITYDVPQVTSEEIVNKKIDCLQKGREEVVKEFSTKLANIDRQIEELRALPAPDAE